VKGRVLSTLGRIRLGADAHGLCKRNPQGRRKQQGMGET
jgi:hypothetical protein